MLARRGIPCLDVACGRETTGLEPLEAGAHGVLAASIFHSDGCTLRQARAHLRGRGFPVRP